GVSAGADAALVWHGQLSLALASGDAVASADFSREDECMAETFRVLSADPIHEDGRKILEADGALAVDVETGLDQAALIERMPRYDALIVRSKTKVTEPVIAAGTALKVIG